MEASSQQVIEDWPGRECVCGWGFTCSEIYTMYAYIALENQVIYVWPNSKEIGNHNTTMWPWDKENL